jgi:4-aminobutyrate aminotransferase-like enzyme
MSRLGDGEPLHMVTQMKSMNQKRSRLRGELRQAYSDWLGSVRGSGEFDSIEFPQVDVSGCPDANKAEWFAYQAAKSRLIRAYAEDSDLQ